MTEYPRRGGPVWCCGGVGNRGWPMAACRVKAGCTVNVADARQEVANNFVQQVGGFAPDTLSKLAGASDVIVTMLPTSVIVERVLSGGDDKLFPGMKPGTAMTHITPGPPYPTQALAEKVAALGRVTLTPPVCGRPHRAQKRDEHR